MLTVDIRKLYSLCILLFQQNNHMYLADKVKPFDQLINFVGLFFGTWMKEREKQQKQGTIGHRSGFSYIKIKILDDFIMCNEKCKMMFHLERKHKPYERRKC